MKTDEHIVFNLMQTHILSVTLISVVIVYFPLSVFPHSLPFFLSLLFHLKMLFSMSFV